MVLLVKTPAILHALEYLKRVDDLHATDFDLSDESFPFLTEPGPIAHEHVIGISRRLQKLSKAPPDTDLGQHLPASHLNDLLRGARIYVAPPKPRSEPVVWARIVGKVSD